MARIRSIKPGFWGDYKLAKALSRDERLFYISLWNEADDEGRLQAHPVRLKGVCFPYDEDVTSATVEGWLGSLKDANRLILFDVDGEPYAQLTTFLEHQKINRPSPSFIPAPQLELEGFNEDSRSPHGALTDGKGRGKGNGKGKGRVDQSASGTGKGQGQDGALMVGFEEFWRLYPLKVGKKATARIWKVRMRAGTPPEEILQGLRRYVKWTEATNTRPKHPSTFIGPDEWWTEAWHITEAAGASRRKEERSAEDASVAELQRRFQGLKPDMRERPKPPPDSQRPPPPTGEDGPTRAGDLAGGVLRNLALPQDDEPF